MKATLRIYHVILLLFSLPAGHAAAQERKVDFEGLMNKLLAPGPLIKGHEDLEHKDCLKCHEPAGGIPNQKCLDCHTEIQEQVLAKKSFHGSMNQKPCIDCHKDHKGRDYNSLFIDQERFNHNLTGYPLEGGHAKVKCQECHTQTRKEKPIRQNEIRYFGTSTSCLSCHTDDDVHFFEGKFKKEECSVCHTVFGWKQAKSFDHGKETGYPLIGQHGRISCKECHVKTGERSVKYDWPALETRKCLSCHQDHHGDKLSPKFRNGACDQCHSQETWNIERFNHEVTSFPLRGQHAQNQCIDCHKQPQALQSRGMEFFQWGGLNKTCGSCHEDYHGYRNHQGTQLGILNNCVTCHNEMGWKNAIRFNHNSQTRFPITGKHLKNACFDCHIPLNQKERGVKAKPAPDNSPRHYQFPELTTKTCETCHRSPHSDDFHRRFKNVPCSACHTPDDWNAILSDNNNMMGPNREFHQKTRFPLTGSHVKQPCKSCHLQNGKEVFKFPNADKKFCINCHDNVHREQFSKKFQSISCADCHTTISFDKRPPFNHDVTDFPLTGQHKKFANQCQECHKPSRKFLPTDPPKRANQYLFAGKERGYCENCHNNVHRKQFRRETQAKGCVTCHSTTGFDKLKTFDHDITRFKLTGSHEKIGNQCIKCHTLTNEKLPTNPPRKAHRFVFPGEDQGFCVNCHKNQHRDMFQPKFYSSPCAKCHTTVSFEKLKSFNHRITNFPLKGKHRKVGCEECHVPTKKRYQTPPYHFKGRYRFPELAERNCQTCHQDPHKGTRGPQCSKCHTESGWKNADGFHRDFTLVGVHLVIGCDQCHQEDRMLNGSSEDCRLCHREDDPHHGFLNPCSTCHTQTFWNVTKFDHNLTMFPLTGAHRMSDCRSCHNQGVYQGLPNDCYSCHFNDALQVQTPNHNSPRYQPCEQCHNTFSFKGASSLGTTP